MYDQFLELTNQLYWEGYAEQLAKEDPMRFQLELNDFMDTYQFDDNGRQNLFTGESHH